MAWHILPSQEFLICSALFKSLTEQTKHIWVITIATSSEITNTYIWTLIVTSGPDQSENACIAHFVPTFFYAKGTSHGNIFVSALNWYHLFFLRHALRSNLLLRKQDSEYWNVKNCSKKEKSSVLQLLFCEYRS